MKGRTLLYPVLLLLLATLVSCGGKGESRDNSIYYWRTTFTLSKAEREFLKDHDVNKLYIHFFDVDDGSAGLHGEAVVPAATIQFKDSVPAGMEVVPTIFITDSAIKNMRSAESNYARKIYDRVYAMCKSNGLEFNELQLDCDWTETTRDTFFRLCREVKKCMMPAQTLSSTIRLHQLKQSSPPVDKGVLMVYNTGSIKDVTTENSIFSKKDIAPYLRDNRLAKYALPLDVAYPVYGWSVVFYKDYQGNYDFRNLVRRTDFSDFPQLRKVSENVYEVTANVEIPQKGADTIRLFEEDIVRVEQPDVDEIINVKKMIDSQLADKPHNNIIYHLDETQFSKYSNREISKIYTRN